MAEIHRETADASFWSRWTGCAAMTPRDRRNQRRILWTLLAWALCFIGSSYLLEHELLPAGPLPWLVAAIPTLVGIAVIAVYARFLHEADELQRLIQLQALALAFGGTFFAIAGYEVFQRLGAPEAGFEDAALVMAVLYTAGVILGGRRYR